MNSLLLATMLLLQGPVITSGGGTITGRILSMEGVPAAGVRVTAMALREPGQAEGISVHSSITQTDGAGRYRLEDVPPGRYHITAGFLDAPTYYPGVSTLSTATVIVVADGTTKEGVDFQLKIPAGMKVSGRMAVLPTPRAAPAAVTLGSQAANVNTDGTFEFQRVAPGRYTLQNSFGLPALSVIVTDRDVTGLEIGRGAVGVRVSGRIVSPDSPPGTLAQTVLLGGTTVAGTSFQARSDANGAFEFLKVPPGNYTLRFLGAGGMIPPTALAVVDQEITNLEVRTPFQSELSGRVVLEDGRPWTPQQGIGIEARRSNGMWGTNIQANGSFRFALPEGEYQIALRAMPLGYVLRGISAGDSPLTGPVKIAPGVPALTNVVVTLANVPLESIQGVKVSGQIIGVPSASRPGTSIVITGNDPGMNMIEAAVNADGTFEFPRVPPGNYTARVNGIANLPFLPSTPFLVGRDNISGIQIPVEVRTTVTGRATAVDPSGNVVPGFPTGVSVWFFRGRFGGHYNGNGRPDGTFGSAMTTVRPDGTFSLSLTEGEYVISFERLSPGYTVKSITSGSIDLLKTHLTLEKGVMPPLIQVQIEAKP